MKCSPNHLSLVRLLQGSWFKNSLIHSVTNVRWWSNSLYIRLGYNIKNQNRAIICLRQDLLYLIILLGWINPSRCLANALWTTLRYKLIYFELIVICAFTLTPSWKLKKETNKNGKYLVIQFQNVVARCLKPKGSYPGPLSQSQDIGIAGSRSQE